MGVRVKQGAVIAIGVAVAVVMLLLGLWQMQVFEEQGNRSAADRAAQAPVPLLGLVNADGTVGDVYGKQVTVSGHYLPEQQVAVVAEDGAVRVLTAFEVADGRVVPVVRGVVPAGAVLPDPPAGEFEQVGIFLPSEPPAELGVSEESLASVRLPLLAQRWPQQLVPGFVTLSAVDAQAQGLTQAQVSLPTGEGSWRNGGYALQWWVFAAFALALSVRMAHTLGRRGSLGSISDHEE